MHPHRQPVRRGGTGTDARRTALGATRLRFSAFFVKARLVRLAGSGLGLGYLPVAPGTWGSAGGLLVWWLTLPMGRGLQALLLILAAVPAALACGACARESGRKDPSFVVLDEVLGMYLALLFLSPSLAWVATAFVLFRLLDILKPWPVSLMEKRFAGGAAILLDDLLAGAITGLIMIIIQILITVI
ncbi:MAG: phosphatidylglycerophosphatase A [Gammaproteobacteria bacterium]|nr:phosphatidylglycerophosphatase A [Gammaproteobacteria bacterium]MYF59706.1 phosphatidylglycerophosphatase A [Gammaproteobacteria bacterium]